MELDDFNCPLCECIYNMSNKLPRLLIKCGHTFCEECLENKLSISGNNSLECPEDLMFYENINKIEDLPKNITVINLMQKFEKRRSLDNLSTTINSSAKSYFKELYSASRNSVALNDLTKSRRDSIKDDYPFGSCSYISDFNTYDIKSPNTCSVHRRPLEIVCLDDKLKICTSCALFGEHKNHKLRSEDEILKEVSIKAEILIEFYDIIEKNNYKIEFDENKLTQLKQKVLEKSSKAKINISKNFKKLRIFLKSKQKQLLDEIDLKYEKVFDRKIDDIENRKSHIRNSMIDWKKNVQQILDNLNEITEFNENIYNFLENKKDYILSAEELMDELEILTDDTILNNYDTNLQLKTNFDFFNNNFNHFCELIITEPDDKLVNIEKKSLSKRQSQTNFYTITENYISAVKPIEAISIPSRPGTPPALKLNKINLTRNSTSNSFVSVDECKVLMTEGNSSYLSTSPSTSSLTSDKIVFIKNQLKNEVAMFSGYLICNEGAKKISDILLSTQYSTSPSKRSNNKLKELKFTNCGLTDDSFSLLVQGLERCNSIQTILINKNKLQDESYTNLLNLIKNNKQLRSLNMTANSISSNVKEKIKNISRNLNSNLKIDI